MNKSDLAESDIVKHSITGELLKVVSIGPRCVKVLKFGGILMEYHREYLAQASAEERDSAKGKFQRANPPVTAATIPPKKGLAKKP